MLTILKHSTKIEKVGAVVFNILTIPFIIIGIPVMLFIILTDKMFKKQD
jgi:hypothetical protein